MNPKLRALLLANGLRADATDEQAWSFWTDLQTRGVTFDGQERVDGQRSEPMQQVVAPPASTPAAPPAPITVLSTGSEDGFARAVEIMQLCDRHGIVGEVRAGLLDPAVTLDAARAQILDHLSERSRSTSPGFAPTRMERGVDEADKFRAAALAGLFGRAGLRLDGERGLEPVISTCGWTLDGARAAGREFNGYSLRELARECLKRGGHAHGGDPLEMVGRALVTSDLPALMAAISGKALFEGYEGANETWEVWADGSGSVPDFKTNTIAMASEFDDLDAITNDTGYQYGDRTDAKETYQLATYGKLAAITRTTIINDDLAALTDMYMAMGEAASRKIGDVAYGVLTTNGNMRDSVTLFHANHGNLGTAGVVSEATIGEAVKLAGLQKGLKSKQYLNIPLQYFIAPRALEGSAEIFFSSNQFASDNKGATRANIYGGTRFVRAYDARLDASSSTAYYFAGPKRKTVRLFFLNGNRAPYLEQRTGWTVDGAEYKVRIDCVAKAVDWKAMVKNAGA